MNNRFKFRIWDNFSETWLTDFAINQDGEINRFFNSEEALKRRFVLMQSTGLKDKNGKLIYEGDIMLVYGKIKEVVYWSKRQFQLGKKHSYCANCKEIGYKRTCPTCYKYQSITATTSIKLFEESEVIGNIYENEDLLNG